MNIFSGNSTAGKLSVMAALLLQGLVPASAWEWNVHPDCELEDPDPGECDTSAVWWWAHDGVADPSYGSISHVGVAENQSSSLGTPAIIYVAHPTNPTVPYYFEVKTNIGSVIKPVAKFKNTATSSYSIISTPSLSITPSGDAYAAFAVFFSDSTNKRVNIYAYKYDGVNSKWGSTNVIWPGPNLHGYGYEVGPFDVQIYDLEHWVFGGSFWSQATSTSEYYWRYRLYMKDGSDQAVKVLNQAVYSDFDDDEPELSGPVPFSYKVGNSSSSPSTLVYNAATSYGSTGAPIAQQLKAFHYKEVSGLNNDEVELDSIIKNTYVPYFALVTTNANKRHVVYQYISTPPTPNWLYCATSSAVNSWSTHQPVASGPWGYEAIYGEPIAAAANPNASSDAFDVFCWAPASYDPNIATVLRHSSGTSYTIDNVITDTSSVLSRPGSKSIGVDGEGGNTVSLYTSLHGSEVAVSYEVE
ncbi:MAG: hypothetical protein JNK74_06220 [Candidatus Hydrogenedentes bacterium]|nr:hypothetical protein [Candidatus Hydrogenedentota bacterium]